MDYATAVTALLATLGSGDAEAVKATLLPPGLSYEDPLTASVALMLAVCAWCFFGSIATGNYSQVDRLWSIVPFAYVWVFAGFAGFADTRLNLMAALSTAWGLRLSYNFARKGGYTVGHEDYRWPALRKAIPNPLLWQAFNLTFIALYQNVLLWLTAAPPAYVAWRNTGAPLNEYDALAAGLYSLLLFFETLTDQQQWNFQQSKYNEPGFPRVAEWADDYQRGFRTTGVFRYSRHLNFFCEQSIWWSFYIFSVGATDGAEPLNACILGAVLLSALFQGSTWYTEKITLEKYPAYADYQRVTSALIPMPPFGQLAPPPSKSD